MAKRPTLAAVRARLSPRAALAAAARDAAVPVARAARREAAERAQAAHKAALKLARHEAAVAQRRAADKAKRDADLPRVHANAKRYRASHPEVEAARYARFKAAKKARAKAERARQERKREYDAKRRARLAAESCQLSP
jgi:hypothetical protein